MFVDFHFLSYEELKIGLLIEEILHDYRVAIDHSVHWTFFDFFLEELDRGVLLFEHALNGAEEAYPASFLVVVDVWLVANNLKANIAVELFL